MTNDYTVDCHITMLIISHSHVLLIPTVNIHQLYHSQHGMIIIPVMGASSNLVIQLDTCYVYLQGMFSDIEMKHFKAQTSIHQSLTHNLQLTVI